MLSRLGIKLKRKKLDKIGLLGKEDINKYLKSKDLVITPLLEQSQIGEISIDLRVGTDFLTNQLGREPFIDAASDNIMGVNLKSHFTETRRLLGEPFLFHPSQTILFSTLEYIKLPDNVMAILSARSSYSRLGLSISTILQPGYSGCISVEVNYNGNIPLRVLTGTRLIQARLYKLDFNSDYFNSERKYVCQVRPIASKANEDKEIEMLKKFIEGDL
jgi:dCTP deaminase